MVRAALGPVAQYDRKGNADLLHTLAAFFRSGGHHPTAAAACHIHSSTLKYRLGRITTILERSLTDPQTQFELMLAFATLDALRSLGIDDDEVFAPGA
jgi:DNA-binding PucR family transcriptional regulator